MASNFTHAQLLSWFDYDEMTGCLLKKGTQQATGRLTSQGYLRMEIKSTLLYVHRVIWFYIHGKWPVNQIDHINRVKNDNRIYNLREATNQQNRFNLSLRQKNSSGYTGVSWNKNRNKWHACIGFNDKHKNLGFYVNKTDAINARQTALKEMQTKLGMTTDAIS